MSELGTSIFHRSDTLIRLPGPTDETAQTPITGATVTARLYDSTEDSRIADLVTHVRGNEAAAQTIISIPKIRPLPWRAGDTVRVELDDGSAHETTISGAPDTSPADEDRITLAVALPSAAEDGSEIRLRTKASGATILPVVRADSLYSMGDQVELRQDDGTRLITTITQIQVPTVQEGSPLADVADHPQLPAIVTLAGATAVAISPRALFLRKIGADISMAQYGTAVANDDSWGYQGTVQQTHADLELGMQIRVEIDFAGGGIESLPTFDALVVRG